MKSRWYLGILIGLAMLAPMASAEDLRSTVEAGNNAWNQAFNQRNAAALTKLYTSDAKLLPPADKVVAGDKNILEFWRSLIDAGVTDHKIETVQIEEAGNTAVVAGKWQAMGKDAQGKAAIFKGSVVKVLKRQGDTWKTSLHTWNIAQ
jgi:ketosteroid isomerase-like protein